MSEIFQFPSSAYVPTCDIFLARRGRSGARAERINTFARTYGSRIDGQMDIRTDILIANATLIYIHFISPNRRSEKNTDTYIHIYTHT